MGSVRRSPRTRGRPKNEARWEARYRDSFGHQRTRTFKLQADAKAFVATADADVIRGAWLDPAGGKKMFSDWEETWWPSTSNLRRSTRVRDRGYIDRYILPIFGDQKLGDITHQQIQYWVLELSDRGLSPATVTTAYGLLRKTLNAAVDSRLIQSSPCRKIALPKIEREEMRFLNPTQVERLAQSIDERYRVLVLVGCYAGLRIGELAGLRLSRINLLKGTIEVVEIADETSGYLSYGPPKTRASRRTVSLPNSVMKELTDHVSTMTSPESFVFRSPNGDGLRVSSWRRRFWLPAVKAAGLEPLRPHDMRHTAVAIWIAAGATNLEVSRRAGHTSTSFTLDRYGHLFPAADEALRERLDALIAEVPHLSGEQSD
jgi:integrase